MTCLNDNEDSVSAVPENKNAEPLSWINCSPEFDLVIDAMVAVALEVAPVAKTSKTPSQMGGYSYRGIDDVVNTVSPLMAKNGLIIIPAIKQTKAEQYNEKWRMNTVRFQFRIAHRSGQYIDTEMVAQALDPGDKAIGKSTSYALRELLCRMFLIPTGDDTEATNYGGGNR
jgi:hypothetical protein|tara:strand:- start:23 stop:535 length:513 start_codon:yes stop_codon:yes gene_type:complete